MASLYQNLLEDPAIQFPGSSDQASRLAQMQRVMQQASGVARQPAGGLPKIGGPGGALASYGLHGDPFQAPQGRRQQIRVPPAQMPQLPEVKAAEAPVDNIEEGVEAIEKQFGPKRGPDPEVARALDRAEQAMRGLRRPIDLSDIEQPRERAMTPLEGPDTGAAKPTGPAPSSAAFVKAMLPHALRVAKATGVDPRLVLAQSALETGWGQSVPGNNYFGIKGGNGPAIATKEAGPDGKLYDTADRFRGYKDPGESADDYARFLQTQSRYAPVLAAKGIDAQIDAMGKSGYASDPNYAAKLRSIVGQLPALDQEATS